MTREQLTAILTATRTEHLRTRRGALIQWDVVDDGVELNVDGEATDDSSVFLTLSRSEAEELTHGLAAALLAD